MIYSLRNRLITAFVLLFVLSFGVMSLWLFNESRSIIRTYIESSALEKMEEYGSYIDMVQMQIYDLASLVYNSEITGEWEEKVSDPAVSGGEKMLANIELSEYLTHTTNSYTSVSSVTIYSQDGLWVSGDNMIVSDKSFLQAAWYNELKDNNRHWVSSHIDKVEERRNNKHPVVSMLMPIGTFNPSLAHNVMKVNVSEAYFLEPLNRIHLGQSGTIYLLDQNGQPILSQDEYDVEMDADTLQAIQSIRDGKHRQGVMYMENESGTNNILVYKKLARTKWMLIGYVSENDLYAELFKLRNSIFAVATVLLILSIIIALALSHSISRPLSRLVMAMRHVQRGEFGYAEVRIPPEKSVRNEVGFVTETFRHMVSQLRQHIKNEFELKLLRQQAEYKALLLQINPHFLFNTLELVSSLALQDRKEDTVKIIGSLGKMMRFSLKMNDDLVPLAHELKYVSDYLSILQVRYGDRLQIGIKQDDRLERVTIIKFIIQPLIENAVKYSFRQQPEAKVDISVRRTPEQRIIISVADNGPGIGDEVRLGLLKGLLSEAGPVRLEQILMNSSSQIGLGNVLARCKLYYGELFEARIGKSVHGGALIELEMPIQEESAHVQSNDRG